MATGRQVNSLTLPACNGANAGAKKVGSQGIITASFALMSHIPCGCLQRPISFILFPFSSSAIHQNLRYNR
jgi:hypothetical protein